MLVVLLLNCNSSQSKASIHPSRLCDRIIAELFGTNGASNPVTLPYFFDCHPIKRLIHHVFEGAAHHAILFCRTQARFLVPYNWVFTRRLVRLGDGVSP